MRYCSVGCDLDGVLADGFTPPEPEFVIISGRQTDDWPRTIAQVGTSRPIYLRPPHFPGDSPHWKAAIIQACGITRFYEDLIDQATEIRRICPSCVVLLVRQGQVIRTMN
jgi:hypothetical protein